MDDRYWVTEITHCQPKKYFVDEQRFGPFKFWQHKHFLTPVEEGVEMEDIVDYKIPFLPRIFVGLFNKKFIKPKLTEIFAFRRKKLEQIFPKQKFGNRIITGVEKKERVLFDDNMDI